MSSDREQATTDEKHGRASDSAVDDVDLGPFTSENGRVNEAAGTRSDADVDSPENLRARVNLLEAENTRLRTEYARQRRTEYGRAALGLAGVGVLAVAGAALFPAVRSVLLVVGAIGVFGGLLTQYLTPERFVSAEIGERVFAVLSGNEAALAGELGLSDERVYVPVGEPTLARLFVPHRREYEIPDTEALSSTFVVTDDDAEHGLALTPTGAALYREFERGATMPPADDPTGLVDTLAESVVEAFEIADSVATDVDPFDGRATMQVRGDAFGNETQFDGPIASVLAVGLAASLETPVRMRTATADDGYTVDCRWEPTDAAASATPESAEPVSNAEESDADGPQR